MKERSRRGKGEGMHDLMYSKQNYPLCKHMGVMWLLTLPAESTGTTSTGYPHTGQPNFGNTGSTGPGELCSSMFAFVPMLC